MYYNSNLAFWGHLMAHLRHGEIDEPPEYRPWGQNHAMWHLYRQARIKAGKKE